MAWDARRERRYRSLPKVGLSLGGPTPKVGCRRPHQGRSWASSRCFRGWVERPAARLCCDQTKENGRRLGSLHPVLGSNFSFSNDSTRRSISDAGTRNVSARSIIVDSEGLFLPRSRNLMYVR